MVNVPQYEMVKERFDAIENPVWKKATTMDEVDSLFKKTKIPDHSLYEIESLKKIRMIFRYGNSTSAMTSVTNLEKGVVGAITDLSKYGKKTSLGLSGGLGYDDLDSVCMFSFTLRFDIKNNIAKVYSFEGGQIQVSGIDKRACNLVTEFSLPGDNQWQVIVEYVE